MAITIKKITINRGMLSRILQFLTKETVKMATLQFHIVAFIKCAPFELEGKSVFRVKMFQSKWKLGAWHVINWIYSLQTAFLLISFAWALWKEPFGEDLVMHLIYIVGAIAGWVFMMSLYLKPRECLLMLNQHELILKATEEARVKISHWASHYFVILAVYYFSFALLGMWFVQATMFLWKPTSTKHIYAYLPLNWQQSYAVFAVALFYELSWTSWYLTTLGTFFCYWCADVFTINDILASLTSKKMTTEEDVRLYRYLQLFCVLFNDFNGSFFTVGFTTVLVVTPIVFIYLALTATYLNLLMYLMLPLLSFFCVFLIMFFLPQHSKVGMLSEDLVKALRTRLIKAENGGLWIRNVEGDRLGAMMGDAHRRHLLKKRIQALPSLGIRIWFFGIYTLQTSQELIGQLFNNIILLLAL